MTEENEKIDLEFLFFFAYLLIPSSCQGLFTSFEKGFIFYPIEIKGLSTLIIKLISLHYGSSLDILPKPPFRGAFVASISYRTYANKGRSCIVAAPLTFQAKNQFLCPFYAIILRSHNTISD